MLVTKQSLKAGFSLIESAIVLAIVGLIVGGIWVAATSIQSRLRVNDTASAILQVSQAARQLFPLDAYPKTNGTGTGVTQPAAYAGVFPMDFKLGSGNFARSSSGSVLTVGLSCYGVWPSDYCPMLSIGMQGPGNSAALSKITPAECIEIIRRFGGLARDRTDFLYAQVMTTANPSFLFLYPPINPALVNCPSNFSGVTFWFKP